MCNNIVQNIDNNMKEFEQVLYGDMLTLKRVITEVNIVLIKYIKKGIWPIFTKACHRALDLLLSIICHLSRIGKNEEAFAVIEDYSFSALIRCYAIDKIANNSGNVSGKDLVLLNNDNCKIKMFRQTNKSNYTKYLTPVVRQVSIPKSDGGVRVLGIGNKIDVVLQTQLCVLLDPYYEAKYSEYMFGFRKGRNTLQAVALLTDIINRADKGRLGIGLIEIKGCFDNLSHEAIIKYFQVPNLWKFHVTQWISPLIYDTEGFKIGRLQKGVPQGSVIGPLICNVLLHSVLFIDTNAKLNLFSKLKTNFTDEMGKRHIVYRKMIAYADDLIITTTNSSELTVLITLIKDALTILGLEINQNKTQLLHYDLINKIRFNLFGFTFLYLPYIKYKKGGIIRRDDILSKFSLKSVSSRTTGGTHFIYPSNESFQKIKTNIKTSIKQLRHKTVFEVIREVNAIIRGWVGYFAWSSASQRLVTLEHYIFKWFKKGLIRKFRNRGIYRIKWVVNTFFLCNQDDTQKGFMSPYFRRWHLHVPYPKTQNNLKRLKDVLWLLLPTKLYRILSISINALPPNVRNTPYYLNKQKYLASDLKIINSRKINLDYKISLYLKQKGICTHCNLPLSVFPFENLNKDIPWLNEDSVELHHIVPIAVGYFNKTKHHLFNNMSNLTLIHKQCHFEITYTKF